MTAVENDGNIIERTSQYIDNIAFDEETRLPTVQLGGTDGVDVTRLKINSDGSINAVTGITPTYKTLIDKTTTTDVVYVGQAVSGTATSAGAWTITKINKSASPIVITHTGATAIYDNRVSETYS